MGQWNYASGAYNFASIYPGQTGILLGTKAIPGTPIVEATNTLVTHTASSGIVVAPRQLANTQRQITWQVYSTLTGSPAAYATGLQLQASIDQYDTSFVTIDTNTGATAHETRVVQADTSAVSGPGLQSALKIISSARFFRVYNPTTGSITATVKIVCQ